MRGLLLAVVFAFIGGNEKVARRLFAFIRENGRAKETDGALPARAEPRNVIRRKVTWALVFPSVEFKGSFATRILTPRIARADSMDIARMRELKSEKPKKSLVKDLLLESLCFNEEPDFTL